MSVCSQKMLQIMLADSSTMGGKQFSLELMKEDTSGKKQKGVNLFFQYHFDHKLSLTSIKLYYHRVDLLIQLEAILTPGNGRRE